MKFIFRLFFILAFLPLQIYPQMEQQDSQVDFLLDLIASYLNSGSTELAIELLNKLSSLYPENYDIRLYRAVALCIQKDYSFAFEELERIENTFEESKRREGRPLAAERDRGLALSIIATQKEKIIFSKENKGLLYFARGVTFLMHREDLKSARERFYLAIKEGYDPIEAFYLLIYTLVKSKDYKRAFQELSNLSKRKEKSDIDFFIEGFLNYQREMMEEALSSFKNALEKNPALTEAKKNIACIHYNRGEYEKAIKLWKEILRDSPDDFESKLNIARAYFNLGRIEEAKKEYESLNLSLPIEKYSPKVTNPVFISPERWIKFNFVSKLDYNALLNHGIDPEKIKNPKTKSLILLTLNEKALFALKTEGKIEDAIKILTLANQIDRTNPFVNYNLGQLYFAQKNFEKAKGHALQAIQYNYNFPEAHDLLGNIYFEEGRYKEAVEEFKKVVEISKTDAQGYYNLGCAYWKLRDWDKAEEAWKKAILYDSKISSIEKKEKFTQEGLSISIMVRKRSVAYRAYISLASLYEAKGSFEDAIKEYENAIEHEPTNPEAYFELGKIYFNLKSYEKARI